MECETTSEQSDVEEKSPASSTFGSATLVNSEGRTIDRNDTPRNKGKQMRAYAEDDDEVYQQQRASIPARRNVNPVVHTHAEQFRTAMESYQESIKGCGVQALDLKATHSWESVLRLAKDVEKDYVNAGKKGPRRFARLLGNQAQEKVSYLKLIPNDLYASIVAGGLKIIFQAAISIGEEREKILKSFLRIPEIILQAEHMVETFYPDPGLNDKADALYLAILNAVQAAAEWMKQSPGGKQRQALMQGSQYNKRFNLMMEELEGALTAMEARVTVLRDDAIVDTKDVTANIETVVKKVAVTATVMNSRSKNTHRTIKSVQKGNRDLKFVAEQQNAHISSVSEGVETINKKQDSFNAKIDGLHDRQHRTDKKVENLADWQQAKAKANQALSLAMRTAKWREEDKRALRRMERQIQAIQKATHGLSGADLLELLGISAEIPLEDFRRAHQQCQRIKSEPEYNMVYGVYRGARFSAWLDTFDSAALFIEGASGLAMQSRFASLSIVSCSLIEYLQEPALSALTIQHFCRRHTSSRDAAHGPAGVMKNLICQVLRLFHNQINLGFTATRRYRDQLDAGNVHILCDCFVNIIKQVPPETVLFCIIDGIDCLEKHEWAEDCQHMMRELQDIVFGDASFPIFKLLVTSPGRSRYVYGTFRSQCRMPLSEEGSDGRHNPTERDMSMGTRRPLKARESEPFRALRESFSAERAGVSDDAWHSDSSWAQDED